MQCPHCAYAGSVRYGTTRGVQRYHCQACRRIFQKLRQGKDPALKQQACQLYLEGMGMRAIGRVLSIHYKTVSRWLVQAAGQLPVNQPKTQACSFIEVDELCSFVAKKIKMLDLGSG
jgi:transposase-like protein